VTALPIFRAVDEILFNNRISDSLNSFHRVLIGQKLDNLLTTKDVIEFRQDIDPKKKD
jgi:hypothetical protein